MSSFYEFIVRSDRQVTDTNEGLNLPNDDEHFVAVTSESLRVHVKYTIYKEIKRDNFGY